jgi:hypothetical protein
MMARHFVVAVLALQVAALDVRAQSDESARVRLERGLAFLSSIQEPDGAWLMQGQKSSAATGLAVMAFLSAGHVPGEGLYQAHLDRALRWVLQSQHRSGLFGAGTGHEMYIHAICTMMLAEVSGMTDAALGQRIKPALEKAVNVILAAQRLESGSDRGGWRYLVTGTDADLSVTGWQFLALRAARNLGCDVPAERIDLAADYVLRCYDPRSGGFAYKPGLAVTKACTGTGILCLELRGASRAGAGSRFGAEILKAKAYLVSQPLQRRDEFFYYTAYYGAQAMYQPRSNYWQVYRRNLHRVLFDEQKSNGSWIDESYGPTYATALAVLALAVEQRLLPLYQRHEALE